MESKEIITAPKADAIIPSGVIGKPSVCGAFNFTAMKMIEDLKQQFARSNSKQKRHFAIYECPVCKKPFRTSVESVRRGSSKSCGCNRKGVNSTHKLSRTYLYKVWAGMKQRCNYPNNISYIRYGARGITVCAEWENDFMLFYNWAISNGYQNKLQIDRENNNKGYSPENCRWVTRSVNCQNTRKIRNTNTSGERGIRYLMTRNKWIARICHKSVMYNLGSFKTQEEAVNAYDNFVINNKTNHPLHNLKPINYGSES